MEQPAPAYRGDAPFVFVSYSHLDEKIVYQEALTLLSRVNESPRLRRSPLLRELWCFRQYAGDPTYKAVLEEQERRRTALRERLPETLATHGVSL